MATSPRCSLGVQSLGAEGWGPAVNLCVVSFAQLIRLSPRTSVILRINKICSTRKLTLQEELNHDILGIYSIDAPA